MFHIYFSQQVHCEVTKCCPIDFALKIENGYSCELPMNYTDWTAHNILPLSSPLPACNALQNVFDGNQNYIELNGCVDQNLSKQYVALECSQYFRTGLHLLNKCCPYGQSYDYSERSCVQDPYSQMHFTQLLGDRAVIFENKVPDCSENEVFVEYLSTDHSIYFEGKYLNLNGNIVMLDKFCIENLVNINPSEYMNNEKDFIVRSCRHRSICETIPCIRRCCKTDQVMKKLPKQKLCLAHPSNKNLIPNFYDVSHPLSNTQKQIILKGMNGFESFQNQYLFL